MVKKQRERKIRETDSQKLKEREIGNRHSETE